jgi:hypothetical protein
MAIKRFLSKEEAEQIISKCNPYDSLLNEIVKGLQADQSKYAEIDVADVAPIQSRIKYLRKTGCLSYDFQHLKIIKVKNGDNQETAFIRWTEQVEEQKETKKRTKRKAKNVAETKTENTTQNTNSGTPVAQ